MHLLFLYPVSSRSDLLGIKSNVLFTDGWVGLLPIFSGFHGNCELKIGSFVWWNTRASLLYWVGAFCAKYWLQTEIVRILGFNGPLKILRICNLGRSSDYCDRRQGLRTAGSDIDQDQNWGQGVSVDARRSWVVRRTLWVTMGLMDGRRQHRAKLSIVKLQPPNGCLLQKRSSLHGMELVECESQAVASLCESLSPSKEIIRRLVYPRHDFEEACVFWLSLIETVGSEHPWMVCQHWVQWPRDQDGQFLIFELEMQVLRREDCSTSTAVKSSHHTWWHNCCRCLPPNGEPPCWCCSAHRF